MARAKVRLNHAGFAEILHSPGVVDDLEARMQRALDSAQASAPVASGAYRNSLRLETVVHPTRTVVHLVADVGHAMTVEASHGVLARALDAAGGEG